MKEAVLKGFLSQEQADAASLKDDDPSGFDADGKPLERSDVVHDFLGDYQKNEAQLEFNEL